MLAPALIAALAVSCLSLLGVLALHATAPGELAALPASDEDMRRYAEQGYFSLMAAASAAERRALAALAGFQSFGGLFAMLMSFAYGCRRGYANPRPRGWSNAFWALSVVGLGLTTWIFPGVSPQKLDYLLTSLAADGRSAQLSPLVFLLERGAALAALVAFFLVLGHDIGYRLREALEDFGLVEAREEPRGASSKTGQSQRSRRRSGARGPETETASGFGHRETSSSASAPTTAEAKARQVLGVGANASKREIERVYRAQMKRAHPDHGGSVERASALNAARDVLLGR
ncbi:hypothetical protein OGR47_11860 [Methylocystis sp. MJC1]|jgi:hypothetical protein|uniref:J domain-containing protein n=1 Tax=Methylocystis sp. MJC1 TaxID=2654282 RepID=UPI0013EC7F87|nr:hypothetical protein [Methylocystis sp. MJC1]KAF2990068.1 DnaJ-like protein DjlA [Methylocystis sp. MJC1]MBU6527675.1 hypothetical protein [Methylocystis sp. MJC1]UZX10611.1 hypothetical protein OGR47_11860 [Methylocystis sp. MJC1]